MSLPSGKYYIYNAGAHKVADIPNGPGKPQIKLVVQTNADTQQWFISRQPDNTYLITNAGYDQERFAYVDVPLSGHQIIPNDSGFSWNIVPSTKGNYRIKAMKAVWQANYNNTVILQAVREDEKMQDWKLELA